MIFYVSHFTRQHIHKLYSYHRFHSEESLASSSRAGYANVNPPEGIYVSRIHSSVDEISSLNRSPSISSSDESFSRYRQVFASLFD